MEEKVTQKVVTVKPDGTEESLEQEKRRKNIYKIVIATVILLTITGAVTAYYFLSKTKQEEQVACTMEAKICPDGSAVGRSGPMCEFAPCPSPKTKNSNSTSPSPSTQEVKKGSPTPIPDRVYINTQYKYNFKYAGNLIYNKTSSPDEGILESVYFNYTTPANDENNIFIASLSNLDLEEEKAQMTQEDGAYSSTPTFSTKQINNRTITYAEISINQNEQEIYTIYLAMIPIGDKTLRFISDIEDKVTVDKVISTLQTK